MPQLGGEEPAEGSKAWKMLQDMKEEARVAKRAEGLTPKDIELGLTLDEAVEKAADKVKEVNVTDLWVEHLKSLGVHIEGTKVDPRFW